MNIWCEENETKKINKWICCARRVEMKQGKKQLCTKEKKCTSEWGCGGGDNYFPNVNNWGEGALIGGRVNFFL